MKEVKSHMRVLRIIGIVAGVLYLIALTWILFNGFQSKMEYGTWMQYMSAHTNFVPFSTISFYLSSFTSGMMNNSIIVRNLLGNLLPFFPMGILLPMVFWRMKRFFWFLLTQFFVIVAFEAIQLFTTTGSFDVDDVLLNLVGAMIGWLIWRGICRVYAGMHRQMTGKSL